MATGAFIAQQTVELVIAVLSVLGNSLVLYVIWRHPTLKTITNYLIASLAMADLLVGLVGLPCVIIIGLPYNFLGCLVMSCIIVVCTQISIFSLLVIAIERFLAVRFPIFHRQHVTSQKAAVAIGLAWLAGSLVGFVPVFGWNNGPTEDNRCTFMEVMDMDYMVYFNFFGFVLVPLIIIYATYGYIFLVVHSKMKAAEAARNNSSMGFMDGNVPNNVDISRARIKRESQAVTRVLLIVVLFSVCWLPIHIMNSVVVFCNKAYHPAIILGVLLSHANSCLNPVLYSFTNDKFKEAILRTLHLGHNTITVYNATYNRDMEISDVKY